MIEEKHIFEKIDINITDSMLDDLADRYIQFRGKISQISDVENDPRLKNLGFSTERIKKLIQQSTIPIRKSKDPVSDIYRSDLGEMLLTLFFDEEFATHGETFIVPLKNIWDREHNDMPGRGIDLTGYKVINNKIEILIGEAKVSGEMTNPPQSSNEIYKEQNKYITDKDYFVRRISNYSKKLAPEHSANFLIVLMAVDDGLTEFYDVVYGCCLIRDIKCYKDSDYGNMLKNKNNFDPNKVHFVIQVLDKPIEDTIDLFYDKVQQKIK